MFFYRSKSNSLISLLFEFVVLVFGFFISLQVNEWQNNRENREIERQYIIRLNSDFEKSRDALTKSIERMRQSLAELEAGLKILTNEHRNSDDYSALFDALKNATILGTFQIFFGTFEELKDTGHMRLIESSELRESLASMRQKYLLITKVGEIRNMLRGNTFPIMARHVKPLEGNKLTLDEDMLENDPRELYVAMSIIRTNLSNDLSDSEDLLILVNNTLEIINRDLSGVIRE